MIRALALAAVTIFWAGFYAGAHVNGVACRALHGRAPLSWISC